jgi:membrane protein DedA with SNARE-associated domain
MELNVAPLLDWKWQIVSLFVGTFVQEDAAIFAGAYLVAQRDFPAGLALAALLGGVAVGDFLIYGLGMLAGRWDRPRWVAARIDADQAQRWLDRRLLVAVSAARVIPTLSFPTFAACGWFGVPFRRFAAASITSAVIYVSATFTLLQVCGRSLPPWAPTYGWFSLACVVFAIWIARRLWWRKSQRLRPSRQPALEDAGSVWPPSHPGMPPLAPAKVRVALAERIPPPLYYVPLVLQWFWLSLRFRGLTLPTVANPQIEAGGLIGESKSDCMAMAGPSAQRWMATTTVMVCVRTDDPADNVTHAMFALGSAGLTFPVILKPDIGWRGFGVRRVDNDAQLSAYLREFPPDQRVIIQSYVPWHGEAGVFYIRRPGQAQGEIFSLTLRYYPFVRGDGVQSLRKLILKNARTRWKRDLLFDLHRDWLDDVPSAGALIRLATVGSNRVGGLYVAGNQYVTAALTSRFDEIAKSIPEFHFGRFDIRFRTLEGLQRGEDLTIIEINGAGAEAVHIWDPDCSVLEGYRVLFEQQRLMFAIGAANRARGFPPLSAGELIRYQQRQQQLILSYPASG